MFRNHLKTAWRNLLKHRDTSLINICGLAMGMAAAMLIGFWVWDELSFDKYHKNYDSIAQVMQHQTEDGHILTFPTMPFPMGNELRTQYKDNFKYVVMSSQKNNNVVSLGNNNFSAEGYFMEKEAPEMFSFKMIEGDYEALSDPYSIILSESFSRAIFPNSSPLNQVVRLNNKFDVKVRGVYQDLPNNSTFSKVNFISTWDLFRVSAEWIINSEKQQKWDNNSFLTFVQIADNSNFESINKKIVDSKQRRVAEEDKKYNTKIFLNPMKDWHLNSEWDDNGNRIGGPIIYVRIFAVIGVFVLLLACINFMNLSTAKSEKRAKEVGVRKSIGSSRIQLILQFYIESIVVAFISLVVSILLLIVLLPLFNSISGKQMSIPYLNPYFWLTGISIAILTGLIAGSYPALYLSSFKPTKVLKGKFSFGKFSALPRKVLVIVQFTVSILLVIGTIVVYNQVKYSKSRPIGYNRNGLVMVQMKTSEFYGKFNLLEDELRKSSAIDYFAESSSPLTNVWATNSGFSWAGKSPNLTGNFATIWVTHDFGKAINWHIKKGRDFSKDFSDSSSIVINSSAANFIGRENPIGSIIRWGEGEEAKMYTVVGVVDDLIMESPFDPVQPTIYFMDYNNVSWMIMRLNPNINPATSLAKCEEIFNKIIPSTPFDYKFVDSEFAVKFASEEKIEKLSTVFSILAIFISCLGLFGLAAYMTERRTKEIGVRKILGASVFSIWKMLSKDFLSMTIIAFLIAAPIGYSLTHNWLQNYQYRVNLSLWVFIVSGIGAIIVTLLTVSFQSIKAAIANPAKSLKSE